MDSARWSPPIPSGPPALTAWRELDRRTRRELLRATGPHPDPVVGCVAVGYARTMLRNGPRVVLGRLVPIVVGMVLIVVAAAAGVFPASWAPVVAPLVVLPLLAVFGVHRTRVRLRLIRMENVNAPALLVGQAPPAPPPPMATGTPLTVAYDRRGVLRRYARSFVLTVVIAAVLPFVLGRVTVIVLVTMLAVSWVLMAYTLVRWVLPGRPVLVVDGGGLRFAGGFVVPWPEIVEIRVHPARVASTATTSRYQVIAFVCADPQRTLARARGLRRRNARRALEYYGSPAVISDRALDHTTAQITAAVTSFHPVQVRRFGV